MKIILVLASVIFSCILLYILATFSGFSVSMILSGPQLSSCCLLWGSLLSVPFPRKLLGSILPASLSLLILPSPPLPVYTSLSETCSGALGKRIFALLCPATACLWHEKEEKAFSVSHSRINNVHIKPKFLSTISSLVVFSMNLSSWIH